MWNERGFARLRHRIREPTIHVEGMTMRKYVMTSIVLLPLLLTFSHAAQNWSVDPPAAAWIFSSEDSGTSSYLGVDISDVTTERLSALKLKEEKGVEVTMVDQDAPAGPDLRDVLELRKLWDDNGLDLLDEPGDALLPTVVEPVPVLVVVASSLRELP